MATEHQQRLPHLLPQNTRTTEGYTYPKSGGGNDKPAIPPKDRGQHAQLLRTQFAHVQMLQQQRVIEQKAAQVQTAVGIQVEFESYQGVALAAESLARDSQGIELMNVREQGNQIFATVFVPEGKLPHFERLLVDYVAYRRVSDGKIPRDNQALIDAISAVRVATFDSLWTDTANALPNEDNEVIWWEAWLPAGKHQGMVIADFGKVVEMSGLAVGKHVLQFPERLVILIHGSKAQLLGSPLVLNMIAELRRAKTTAEFFASLPSEEQADWANDLRGRLATAHVGNSYVTLLDTGVNHGHSLLAPMIADQDRHTVEPVWGPNDDNGHGTQLAGLALLGDLTPSILDGGVLAVPHRLESVKILRGHGDNEGESYGAITAEAVARVEITDTQRRRVFAMAVSSTDDRDRGRPSSWSAEVDRLACDYEGQGENPRLFVLCAGNQGPGSWADYPASLSTNLIHDPGQAWNAITVGAYSDLTTISESFGNQYQAIAPVGGLSPYTTSSSTWETGWPFKPDIVMEGGNVGVDATGFTSQIDSLSLLTTGHEPHVRPFTLSWATSAATALAAGMAARIQAAHPEYWRETIRALLVHSARWTQPMLDAYIPHGGRNMTTVRQLLRHCGYGVPSLERALYSASNSLTMIVQDQLQPYERGSKGVRTRDMHLHALPWPIDMLQALGDTEVTLRVSLSYFIEPNPGERGGIDKYAYQSHALRFAVRRPLETEAVFRGRINAQAAEEEQGLPAGKGPDGGWTIGERTRARGSLLSDCWTGTAAQLANRGQLAIFPAMGWWRNRPSLGRFERAAKYSLVVSIEAPTVEQDLYTSVAQQIVMPTAIETSI